MLLSSNRFARFRGCRETIIARTGLANFRPHGLARNRRVIIIIIIRVSFGLSRPRVTRSVTKTRRMVTAPPPRLSCLSPTTIQLSSTGRPSRACQRFYIVRRAPYNSVARNDRPPVIYCRLSTTGTCPVTCDVTSSPGRRVRAAAFAFPTPDGVSIGRVRTYGRSGRTAVERYRDERGVINRAAVSDVPRRERRLFVYAPGDTTKFARSLDRSFRRRGRR